MFFKIGRIIVIYLATVEQTKDRRMRYSFMMRSEEYQYLGNNLYVSTSSTFQLHQTKKYGPCALTELWSWGHNGFNQLGTNDEIDHIEPIKLNSLSTKDGFQIRYF